MKRYLLCYRIESDAGHVFGHAFADMPSLSQKSLDDISEKIKDYTKQNNPDKDYTTFVWLSVTTLDS
jgi:hypothetical protein